LHAELKEQIKNAGRHARALNVTTLGWVRLQAAIKSALDTGG